MPAEQSVRFMLDIGRKVGRRAILVPTSDTTAMLVAENAEALQEWYFFPRQSPQLVQSLANKREMYFLAKKQGIPTAKTIFPRSRADIVKFLDGRVFPIILKGVDPRLPQGTMKAIVHSEEELLKQYDRVADSDPLNLMLQEYIPGGDDTVWMFNGYFDQHSDCLSAFTGRKLRQYPVYAGVASLGICVMNEFVEDTTRSFMKAIGYRGMLDIEYRYDARDGLYKLLDVNPRIGATFRLFLAENDMDVVRIFYLDMTGQAIPPAIPRAGRKWMLEEDIFSCLRYRRDGKLSFQEWVSSLRGVQETAWFALDDPIPFFVWFWRYLIKSSALPWLWRRDGRSASRLRLARHSPHLRHSEDHVVVSDHDHLRHR